MTLHAVPSPASGPFTITLPAPAISQPRRLPPGFERPPLSDCPKCDQPIEVADRIRKVHSVWMHDDCAREAIRGMGASQSWLMLAEHVAATPSAFRASEIRAIVRAVIDIADGAS